MSQFVPLIPLAPQAPPGARPGPVAVPSVSHKAAFIQELGAILPHLEALRRAFEAGAAEPAPGLLPTPGPRSAGGNNLPAQQQVLPQALLPPSGDPASLALPRETGVPALRIQFVEQAPAPDALSGEARQAARTTAALIVPEHARALLDAAGERAGDGRAIALGHTPALPASEPVAALAPAPSPAAPAAQNMAVLLTQSTLVAADKPGSGQQTVVQIGPPVQHPDWGGAVAARVTWQIGEHLQQAQFRIHPPELGPVEVRISVHHDQANVQFIAQHALVRDVLEDSIPRLRDMLGGQGLTLADANVSEQGAGDARGAPSPPEPELAEPAPPAPGDPSAASGDDGGWLLVPSGRLDIYV